MLTVQNVSYIHPNKDLLFTNINLTVNHYEKVGIVGNNGTGKTTLLKLISGALSASGGTIKKAAAACYIPQISGQYNHLTIGEALGIDKKLSALHNILHGDTSDKNYEWLNDDWTIEARCAEALRYWQLSDLVLSRKMETLSGGQKTKVFLARITIHQPEFILLDEPSNHLDTYGRMLLYDLILNTRQTFIIVSHDRKLLNLLSKIYELTPDKINGYGGNFDFYAQQKQIENNALAQDINSKEKALKKAKEKERETIERQQKLDKRGKGKQEKSGVPKIMMNTLRNSAENSTAKLKGIHAEKTGNIRQELEDLRKFLPETDRMKFGFDNSKLHKGKIIFTAHNLRFSYGNNQQLWNEPLDFQIVSGERIAIKGKNGSGKTTLIQLILGNRRPSAGSVFTAETKSVYIDQGYSLIDNQLKVYEQAEKFNNTFLREHEIKIRLTRFLFTKADWEKPCSALSGGERMRLTLCCLLIGNASPDIIVLDEPTNNLDIQNIEILTAAVNEYEGTLLVISHDEVFLEKINTGRVIGL